MLFYVLLIGTVRYLIEFFVLLSQSYIRHSFLMMNPTILKYIFFSRIMFTKSIMESITHEDEFYDMSHMRVELNIQISNSN